MTATPSDEDEDTNAGAQRLDKWLWFARLTKSRTLAATCISEGKIKVNRLKAEKPSQSVRVGDVVTARLHKRIRVVRIKKLGERRGPAAEAQTLYEDITQPAPSSNGDTAPSPIAVSGVRDQGLGRPTKRDRRALDRLKGRGGLG